MIGGAHEKIYQETEEDRMISIKQRRVWKWLSGGICSAALVLMIGSIVTTEAAPLGNVSSCAWNAGSHWFDVACAGGAQIRIIYYRDDIFRIWVGPSGSFTNGASAQCVVYNTPMATQPTLTDAGTYYRIETNECVLRVYKTPCSFGLYQKDNATVVFEEQSPIDITANLSTQTLRQQVGDFFYGCGGWNGHYCHNGLAAPATYGGMNYQNNDNPNPAPYYCNLKGYGAFRNTWQPGTYYFQNPVRTQHSEGRFDCFYFYGPSLKKVLDGYTVITGRPYMPPIWGLDFSVTGDFTYSGHQDGTLDQTSAAWVTQDFPVGSWVPNDGPGGDQTVAPLQQMNIDYRAKNQIVNMWCGIFMQDTTLRTQFLNWGIRFFKIDCEWIGGGYQYCTDAMITLDANGLEKYTADSARSFIQFTAGWAGQQRFGYPWTGDNTSSFAWIGWHIPTLIGSAMSALQGMTVEVAGIGGAPSDIVYLRALQWQAMQPMWFLNECCGGGQNKWPWNRCAQYVNLCRNIFKLRTRLIPYIYTTCHDAAVTGVTTQRPAMLEFPNDPNTWDNGTATDTKTLHEFMMGPWFLCRPVFENLTTTTTVNMYLPGTSSTRWIDYLTGNVATGNQTIQAFAGGTSVSGQNIVMPTYVLEGAIIPLWPPQYYATGGVLQRPRSPLTLDVYPHQSVASSFSYYQDDGVSRAFKKGNFTTTLITSDATQWTTASRHLTLTIGAAAGSYTAVQQTTQPGNSGMMSQQTYFAQIHTGIIDKNTPASVYLDGVLMPQAASQAACSTSTSAAWYYNATDRGGILCVKTPSLTTSGTHVISTGVPVGISNDVTVKTLFNNWQVTVKEDGVVQVVFANMFNGDMKASIYDIQGRLIMQKTLKVVNSAVEVWNGTYENGRPAMSGNYVLKLEFAGKSVSKMFVLQK